MDTIAISAKTARAMLEKLIDENREEAIAVLRNMGVLQGGYIDKEMTPLKLRQKVGWLVNAKQATRLFRHLAVEGEGQ